MNTKENSVPCLRQRKDHVEWSSKLLGQLYSFSIPRRAEKEKVLFHLLFLFLSKKVKEYRDTYAYRVHYKTIQRTAIPPKKHEAPQKKTKNTSRPLHLLPFHSAEIRCRQPLLALANPAAAVNPKPKGTPLEKTPSHMALK